MILLAALVFWKTSLVRPAQSLSRPASSDLSQKETTSVAPSSNPGPASANSVTATEATSAVQPTGSPFESWARAYASGDAKQRSALLARGDELAKARRDEMAELIRTNPEEALHRALPYGLRKQLPESILSQIEQPLEGRGDFRPVYYKPLPGRESEVPPTSYEVVMNKTQYETFIYGARRYQPGHENSYLNGVAVTDSSAKRLLALSESPARILDPEEVADKRIPIDPICRNTSQPIAPASQPTVVQFGSDYFSFCQVSHARQFDDLLKSAHGTLWASGGTGSGSGQALVKNHAVDQLPPGNGGFQQALHKLLYIRVTFADDPIPPQSDNGAQSTVKANNQYFNEGSYNTVWWESTVTPVIRLPQRKNFYGESPGGLLGDAAAGAAALGYFSSDYFYTYVLCNSLPQYKFGGLSSGILNGSPGALSHELGHNFGLPHANFWQPEGRQPGPVQPPNPQPPYPIDPDSLIGHNDINAPFILGLVSMVVPSQEYGNQHDVMGSGPGHFSAMFKNYMDWLPDQFVKVATHSTTNRIYAFDTPRIKDGRFYAMRIRKDFQHEFWLSYRQGFPANPWFSTGLEVDYNFGVANDPQAFLSLGNNVLLDTTPDTTYAKEDAALVVGRTLHDSQASLHITPIAIGGGPDPSDKWIETVVQIGPFPGNQVPTLTLDASALVISNGTTVAFTATAQDADGDQLAYYWDFGDYTFGTNGPVQSKTFDVDGQYVVRCEVSDMKGGVASRHVVLTVGTPTTFTISGRVLDPEGNPVQGVRVHNSGDKPASPTPQPDGITTNSAITDIGTYRYGYTDTDGYYVIGNIPPGGYTNRAFLFGYRTEPLNFTDPVVLNNGNAINLDFVATPLTRVSVAKTRDANEVGASEDDDGIFTLSRTGDISSELKVRFALSGTALINSDYVLNPVESITNTVTRTNNGVVRTFTNVIANLIFPAFVSSLDVHVIAFNNSNGFGDRSVILTLLLQTNDTRITTVLTNVLTTNGSVITTNTMFVQVTNRVRIPGWELRPVGEASTLTWFQTDPTYVLDQAEATVMIIDDDPPAIPTVGVTALDPDAVESRGDTATLLFSRSGAPIDYDLVVNYALFGEAVSGEDFLPLSGSVTIPAGQQYALVPVTAINDLFVEGNEELYVEILPSLDGSYLNPGFFFTRVVIVDDDLPLVNIFAATATVGRSSGGSGRVTFSRAGNLDEPLIVNYFVTGTAVSGVDFNTLSGSITIPAGQLSADVNITPISGSPNSLPRTVTIVVSDSTTYNIFNQNSATVTIFDNTFPTVTLSRTADTVNESGGTAAFVVTRTGPTTGNLNVFFEVGGSAWEGTDYGAIGTNIVIPVGSASVNINIVGINDQAREVGDVTGQDTIIVQLRAGTNYNLGNNTSSTMRIVDDEGDTALPSVGFMLRNSTVFENAGAAYLYVKVTANPATNKPIVVEYRVTSGSAVPNVDYLNLFPANTNGDLGTTGVLFITHYRPPDPPPQFFDFENGIYAVPVQLLDDGVVDGDKTLTITLQNPQGFQTNTSLATNMMGEVFTNTLITRIPTNMFLGPSTTHTLTIQDLKTSTVTVAATATHAYEAGPQPVKFVITRDGATNVPLTVTYVVSGTAANGNDFVPLSASNTVTIPAGTNSAFISLSPLDDPTEEVAESVTLSLLSRPGYHVGFPSSATVILVSDDGTIQFSSATYSVSEDEGPALISVVRTGGTNGTTTVDYRFVGGSASNGVDYLGTNGTITFLPGETIQTISIPLIDDAMVETNETIHLVLTNAAGGVPLGGQKSATVTIVNDDTEFEFASAVFRGNENVLLGEVIISRHGVLTNTDTVTFTTTNGSAGAADFIADSFEVEFLPGESNITVTVAILDDELFEGDETISLSLSNPSADTQLGALSAAALLIVDDEAHVDFELTGFTVNEYSNFVTVVVRRTGGTVNPISVTYATSDGSAIDGSDYVGSTNTVSFLGDQFVATTNGSGDVIFVPGETTRTIQIPIIDDVLGEGNENFTITLSDPISLNPAALPGSTLLGPNASTVVTILDNETPGNVDFEFVAGPNAPVRSVALQSDLKIVIGGDFTLVDNLSLNRIARLQTDGNLDSSFNPGAGANSNVYAVVSQPDGKVVIGGAFSTVNNTNRLRIARLNGDGKLDLGFNPGSGANGIVRAIAVQTNGQVIIAGDFTAVNGTNRSHIARLNVDGSLDGAFNASINGNGFALAIQPDGKILVGGLFTTANGAIRNNLARLNADGTIDPAFAIGTGFNGAVNGIALQANGKILVGGAFTIVSGANRNFFVRLENTGTVDSSFITGTGPNAVVNSVAVHPGGKIVIGGDFISYNGLPANRFVRIKSTGAYDTVFVSGTGANATIRSVVAQPDSAIVIGGDFTVVNGLGRNYVARIHGDERSNIPTVDFAAANFTVDETAGTAVIALVRTGATNPPFTLMYSTANGTATAGQDYDGVTNTVSFAAGQLIATFNVTIQDDLLVEGDETIRLALTNVTPNIDLSGQSTAVLTILDNEKFVQLGATNFNVFEDATNAVITLTRTGGLSGSVTVTLTTSNGTALSGSDYLTTQIDVTFAAGQSNATVLIPIVDNFSGELTERFHVFLSAPVGALLGSPETATVTIFDNDINYGTFNYSNTNAIVILDAAPAVPYPSSIIVSNVTGVVSKVVVSLVGLRHTFPSDIDVLLVGPRGQKVLLMSDAGGSGDVFGITLQFDDSAATALPETAQLVNSTNSPTDYAPADSFQAPAPAGPYANALAAFDGTDANGTWSLYVVDDRGSDTGSISNGWRLSVTTVDPERASDVALTMSDAPDPIQAGATLVYTLTVDNYGPLDVTGVRLTNFLSANVEFISAVAIQGACSNINGLVVCDLGNIPAYESDNIFISVRPLIQGTLTNRAVVYANEPDFTTANNVATVTTTVTPGTTADLRVTLADSPDPVFAGQNVTYHFTVTNRGPLAATGVLVTNRFPENGNFVSVNVTAGAVFNAGNELIIDVGTLANGAGMSGNVIVQSRFGGTMTNTVSARANQPDFSPANTATELTEVIPAADLLVIMSDSRDPVSPGANVIYNVTVVNNGPNDAHNVTLFDTVPVQFALLSFTNSQGTSYDASGVLVFQFGTISNGASASATIVVATAGPGTYTNVATAVAQEGEIIPANNTAFESTTVSGDGGTITVSGIIDNGVIQLGVNPAGHLNVLNGPPSLGGTTAVGLRYLPTGAESTAPGCLCEGWGVADAISLVAGGANVSSDGGTFGLIVESFTTDGVTARSVVRVHGGAIFGGVNTNVPPTFRVTHFYRPSAATTNLYEVNVTIENISSNVVDVLYRRVMDWDIEPTPFNEFSTVIKGDSTNLLFTSDNGFASANPLSGPSSILATNTFVDSGPADHGALFDFGFGLLNPGQSKSFITYYGAAGTERDAITAIARVGAEAYSFGQSSTPGGKTNGTPNTFIFGFGGIGGSALAGSDLAVFKTTPSEVVSLGSVFTYTIRVTNSGPDIATDVVVTDTLPGTVSVVGSSASQGSLSIVGNVATLTIGNMAPRSTATMTISVIASEEGSITNFVSATTTQIDFNTSNNDVQKAVTVVSAGTFANPSPITIFDAGTALPYPSIIRISNAPVRVNKVSATLVDISHTYPGDLDILLVSPQGQGVLLMSDAGAGFDVNGVVLRFDDEAPSTLPAATPIVSGDYKPTNIGGGDSFFSPAPLPPYATAFSAFTGTDPNGDWQLYIIDDQGSDVGTIGGGWRLSFTFDVALRIDRLGNSVVLSWPSIETGYTLESAPAPSGAVWTVITSSPPVVNGRFTVIVPTASPGQQYFRLRKP